MTFGPTDIVPSGSTGTLLPSSVSLGTLLPSSAPSASSPCSAATSARHPSRSGSTILRHVRSLSSLNSAESTNQALAALERGCAKLSRIEGGSAARTRESNSSSNKDPLLGGNSRSEQIHWSTIQRTTLGPEPPPFAAPYGPPVNEAEDSNGRGGGAEASENAPSGSGACGTDGQRGTDWRSLYVATFLSFCTVVQFSLYFSSMWPYLEVLDQNASERFFGYIVASYSLGQILGSPVVGYLSNRMHKIRYLLYMGLLLMFVGNWLYLSVHMFSPDERKYLLCVARFITGIGSSNISLLKAYTSSASTQSDRSRAIAFVTGGVALGSTMGPAFQLLFTPFGYPGLRLFGPFNITLSMYTAPAFMACGMNLINALCIKTMFAENYVGVHSSSMQKKTKGGATEDGLKKTPALPPYDQKAALLCYVTRFTQMFVNTNLETLGAPFAMMTFAWTRVQAVEFISTAQVIMSLLAFLTYVLFIVFRVDKILSNRANLIGSLVVLILFHVLTYSYPFLPGHVQTFRHRDLLNDSIVEPVGCDVDKFNWCSSVRPLPPWYFYTCYVLAIGLAFPNINVALNTLFSKIIGPRRQGTQQGVLQMSGGFARMIGPIVISSLYASYGPQSAWLLELSVISSTLALWFMLFQRMVPLKETVEAPETYQNDQQPETPAEPTRPSTSGRTRMRSSGRAREERKPLVEPICEEEEAETEGGTALNDATVSTMASLGQ